MLNSVLDRVSGISAVVRLVISPETTLLCSLTLTLLQVLAFGYPTYWNLIWHFRRMRHCNLQCIPLSFGGSGLLTTSNQSSLGGGGALYNGLSSSSSPKWIPPVCFILNMIPGLVVSSLLAGFLLWPILLSVSNLKLLFKPRASKWHEMPPYTCQIQELQRRMAEWLLSHHFFKRKEAFVMELAKAQEKSERPLPIEVLRLILAQVDASQAQELKSIKDQLHRSTKKIPKPDYLGHLLRFAEPLSTTSRYVVFVNHVSASPPPTPPPPPPPLHHQHREMVTGNLDLRVRQRRRRLSSASSSSSSSEEIWYAVFSKDACIFAFICLLQITFPYWLYHL